mgnify:CR=1
MRHKLITWGSERHRKNNDIYGLVNQPFSVTYEKTFEDIAEEYDLKLPTVKRIYKEYK